MQTKCKFKFLSKDHVYWFKCVADHPHPLTRFYYIMPTAFWGYDPFKKDE